MADEQAALLQVLPDLVSKKSHFRWCSVVDIHATEDQRVAPVKAKVIEIPGVKLGKR